MAEPANYFPRDVMQRLGYPNTLIEFFHALYLRTGGSPSLTNNLVDINTSVTEINNSVDAIAESAPPSVMVEVDKLRREVKELESLIHGK